MAFPFILGFLSQAAPGRVNTHLSLVTGLTANASSVRCSLMLACYAGHLDVVKCLRRHGASWETRDLGGCTALHWAADGGHCDVIEWMIQDGCEVRVPVGPTRAESPEGHPAGPARGGALS